MKKVSEINLLRCQAALAAEQRDQEAVRAAKAELAVAELRLAQTTAYRVEVMTRIFKDEQVSHTAILDPNTGVLSAWEKPEPIPTPDPEKNPVENKEVEDVRS